MKRTLSLLLILTLLLSFCTLTVSAKSGHALDLVISASENENGEFSVTVTAENITETLHVVEYVVNYDSEKLELVNSVDEDGVLDCITALPKDWENFVGVKKVGEISALALTAGMEGVKNGELKFEFKFRVKDGATGETKITLSDESVLGAYVGGDNEIKEFGGKGGSVTLSVNEGKFTNVSVDTVSVDGDSANGDSADGGNGWIAWVVVGAVAVIGIAVAAVLILKKRNKAEGK